MGKDQRRPPHAELRAGAADRRVSGKKPKSRNVGRLRRRCKVSATTNMSVLLILSDGGVPTNGLILRGCRSGRPPATIRSLCIQLCCESSLLSIASSSLSSSEVDSPVRENRVAESFYADTHRAGRRTGFVFADEVYACYGGACFPRILGVAIGFEHGSQARRAIRDKHEVPIRAMRCPHARCVLCRRCRR